jgi:hypothetical protein
MSCQKVVNVLAVASFAISGAIAVSGVYVYVNRDSIIDGVKSQVMDAVLGGAGGLGDGLTPELPVGTNDLAPDAPQLAPTAPTQASLN